MSMPSTMTPEDRELLEVLYFRRDRIKTAIRLLEQIQRLRKKRTYSMGSILRELEIPD